MIDQSTVKRLAVQYNIAQAVDEVNLHQLQAFAQAVIDNFVSEQKPVAFIVDTPTMYGATVKHGLKHNAPLYTLDDVK